MAENPYVNKVVFGNDTLVDLTNDSVEASNLLEGETAHDRSGAPITGTAKQGHVIKDADGTSMAQQPTLKFGKYMNVTNDPTNGQTVVDTTPTEIQYTDWLELTTEQKRAKEWILLNAPDANSPVVLTQTLTAGSTTLTFTNAAITSTAMVDVYTQHGVEPTDINDSTSGSIVLTFEAQQTDVVVKLKVTEG